MARAKVYVVTGNDDIDDPAWGITPIRDGPLEDVIAWLREQQGIDEYAVSVDDADTVWAVELLHPH